MLLITQARPSQPLFPGLLKKFAKNPTTFSSPKELFQDLKSSFHSLFLNNLLRLVPWNFSGKSDLQMVCQIGVLTLSKIPKSSLKSSITSIFFTKFFKASFRSLHFSHTHLCTNSSELWAIYLSFTILLIFQFSFKKSTS